MVNILVIDDDHSVLDSTSAILRTQGYEVTTADNGAAGIEALEGNSYDLVLTDLKMPGIGGMEVLDAVVKKSPETLCIILTGYGSIQGSVEAIKNGAFDYVTKPLRSSELSVVVEKAMKFKSLEEENTRLKRALRQQNRFDRFVGTSKPMQKIYDMIEKVADTDSTVLITGASGTGKELIARSIHYNSSRSDKPLVVINCGAIPEELLESELFGHKKGAFTGAHKDRIGRFEMANEGTIFLDEVAEMKPSLQVKLLRVLQEQKFERLGDTKTVHVDVRIVAATNKNLTAAINKETFREDLYYRLNVIPIKVPTLKQRSSDIPLLIDFFLKKFQEEKKNQIKGFTPRAMDCMMAFDWPGNVRELENVIKRITILCDREMVDIEDLPEHIQESSGVIHKSDQENLILQEGISFDKAVKEYEKRLILGALEKSNGVKSKAAKLLQIKRTTLVEKIKKQKLGNMGS